MIEKTSPLGRGVNALFSKIKSNSFANVDINLISPNPFQPRTNFSNSELKELAKSKGKSEKNISRFKELCLNAAISVAKKREGLSTRRVDVCDNNFM